MPGRTMLFILQIWIVNIKKKNFQLNYKENEHINKNSVKFSFWDNYTRFKENSDGMKYFKAKPIYFHCI